MSRDSAPTGPVRPALPVQLTLRLDTRDHRARVIVSGEVDMASAPALRAFMGKAADVGCTDLLIDLTDVTFLDSSGVRVLVVAAREAEAANIGFTLLCPASNRVVGRILEILQIGLAVTIVADTVELA